MSVQHQVRAAGFEATQVNHFVAAVMMGEVVAVYNENTSTVQVYGDNVVPHFGFRQVRVTKGNDARVMFS